MVCYTPGQRTINMAAESKIGNPDLVPGIPTELTPRQLHQIQINDLYERLRDAKKTYGERSGLAYVLKTALRIEKARQGYETILAENPHLGQKPFFEVFFVGFGRKQAFIAQYVEGQWVGSGSNPREKVCGDSAETILKQFLGVQW